MELTYSDLPDGIRKIELLGRLDVEGANAIDLRFTALTATERLLVIVDLAGVEFLASLGISTLVRSAQAARRRNGNLVLLSPQPNVAQVLKAMRIEEILPVFHTLDEARVAVLTAPPALN